MSTKAKKANALRAMKEGRGGRLDDYEVQDEEDVYDVYEEGDYQKLVESRRQREDFVVDDDGLGYYDDGEERMGDEETDDKKKRKGGSTNLSAHALKKARKQRQAQRPLAAAAEDGVQQNSMWNFVQRGTAGRSQPQDQKERSQVTAAGLDDLLEELDDVAPTRRSKASRKKPRPAAHRRPPPPSSRSTKAPPSARRGSVTTPRRLEQDENFQQHDNNGDDGDVAMPFDNDDNDAALPAASSDVKSADVDAIKTDKPAAESKDASSKTTDSAEEGDDSKAEQDKTASKPLRRRLGPPKLGTVSAPAAKAAAAAQAPGVAPIVATKTTFSAPQAVDTTGASFRPERIAVETQAAEKAAANLEQVVQTNDSDGSTYIDMFWMDACEVLGDILVFGKVQVGDGSYVSCCAKVQGNKRQLLVLPRKTADGEYVSMLDVHQELKGILQPSCIPLKEGASWAGKVVKRSYAFEDPTIPRDETKYMKVVYDAKHPVPEAHVCEQGSKSIDRILGAGASNLENFIIKRNLMGPCWIRIQNPVANPIISSWCKLELLAQSPKQVSRLTLETSRPPPPVVTVSIKLKTIVNPKTQKSEVVSVSAICHKQVLLDTASDESTKHMTQLSLIRPLGTAANATALPQFPKDMDEEIAKSMPQLQRMPNERSLLSRLFTQLGIWDPDILVGHHAWGYDMQVLLGRCLELKLTMWSKIGRRRKMRVSYRKEHFSNEWAIMEALQGRILCDTYLSAKELLRETTYSLTHLAATQLKTQRADIEPVDIPQWYNASQTIVQLAQHTLHDAQLVQRLMFKLQILPLTKQLTCVAGNLWGRTMKGNRAERTEYLLLHEFHTLKFVPPEKRRGKKMTNGEKAKYAGGLVLEPKRGYYDSFILLLDFNSLYPSIIQEYNLCFTTLNWSNHIGGELPPIPDEAIERGVLPRVIKTLVERRRAVKKLMKNEKNPEKKEELDLRQQALKLTANSMYGCLGYSNSRFYAQPIAAMITAMGRETLQRTVEIATGTVGLDVIYGDTDSIMINTRISDPAEFDKVRQLGEKVKQEVNKLYKTLELEIDGTFRSMLLLKKKKYAAVTAEKGPDGNLVYGKEMKGLDLVRRDWCIQSKDTGRYVLDQILSGGDRELVIKNIHDHLDALAVKMRKGDLPLEKYVITKGLSKHPNDYPDGKSQPHVQVAKQMLKNNRPVNTGDHIPYVICEALEEQKDAKLPPTDRARHPEEIRRSAGLLKPDVEWYLTQQILPPTSRLCEPIDGTSQSILAEKLGLDSIKYNQIIKSSAEIDDEELVDYQPSSCLPDEERFKDAEKLVLTCQACGVTSDFAGVFCTTKEGVLACGLRCTNEACERPAFWGQNSHFECMAKISNSLQQLIHRRMKEYYKNKTRCDDPACGLATRQCSVAGNICLARGCTGKMHSLVSERALYTQVKYLDSLFDISHAVEQRLKKSSDTPKAELLKTISKHDKVCLQELHEASNRFMRASAYNWIEPKLWQSLFAGGGLKQ